MSSHRRPAPESAIIFINDEATRAATGIAMTIGKPEAPVIVFCTTGGALIATRDLKRGHARHRQQHSLDWWQYYVALFNRWRRVHAPKRHAVKFLRR